MTFGKASLSAVDFRPRSFPPADGKYFLSAEETDQPPSLRPEPLPEHQARRRITCSSDQSVGDVLLSPKSENVSLSDQNSSLSIIIICLLFGLELCIKSIHLPTVILDQVFFTW